jgi:NADP-dependent aldehyde dehydrogenase
VVSCASKEELNQIIRGLEGQLTATVLAGDLELINYSDTIASLQNRVGRIIFNGVPTGVEVSPSMVHGGPYPASTDSRFTAVGISAVRRWLRPFSYQNWPKELLPEALQEDNPLDIIRRVDGKIQKS